MENTCQQTGTEKIPGILGGMGPEATVDLMSRIIALTPASDDIDHLRCIVDNNPKVPSRMKAIIDGDGEDPGACMADMGKRLEVWGADFLVIPCNTAHHYYYDVAHAVKIPVVHLIDLVVETVVSQNPGIKQAGVLASTAVLITKLYETRFAARGVEVVYPDAPVQDTLLGVIRRVKAGETGEAVRKDFAEICSHLEAKGAEIGILGCTELGIIGDNLPIHSVDAADVLAREIVAVARDGKMPHTEASAP
ncbi:amino acid racemase [Desulfoluna sp.]|uniref:aspartate/glutamate racemase family protein n=1 Tax=Desulfoluna sp. TaxID=2045199 RepID=UPI00260C65E5|nr:amino acid racemase [Desulfoluna sp.]